MQRLTSQLTDLPDEILLMIFKNIHNVQLLYSMMGVNTRLDEIISDPVFTRNLTLFRYVSRYLICPLVDTELHRFHSQILPQIHHRIHTLNLESSTMERILLAAGYPNLRQLALYNIDDETAERIFAHESPLFNGMKKKIQLFSIRLTENNRRQSEVNLSTAIFINILTMFNNLRYIKCDSDLQSDLFRLNLSGSTRIFASSSLTKLFIKVEGLNDCLHLLDGRFNQLETFFINIEYVFDRPLPMINAKKTLPNMKYFSLTCRNEIYEYEKSIVPILRWMINLEELCLNICVHQKVVFDGNQLKTNILNHLSKLNKFTFNIRSLFYISNPAEFVSNEDIQNSLIDLRMNEIVSYVDYSSTRSEAGQCHMFSYPYTLKYFDGIKNRFPDGLYDSVREAKLFDDHPFEHEFFLRMAKAFPYLEILTLSNRTPQQQKSIDNNQDSAPIEYSHLNELFFNGAHDDYIEQFLMDSKTFLSKSIRLYIERQDLRRVTHNFTRMTTQINCAKVHYLHLLDNCISEQSLTKYFPYATIGRCDQLV